MSYQRSIVGIDFTDLQNPHIKMVSEGIHSSRILHKLSDSYVIAGNEELGFRVLKLGDEIGQDIQFTECGFYDTPGITDGIATDEYFTFIADRSNLGIYDISEALGWQSVGQHGPTATGQWELLSLFPNPFNSTLRIGFSMAKPGLATVSLFDLTGRRVSTLDRRYYSAGIQTLISDQIKLPAGCYFARVEAGGWSQTIPVNCIK
ncbi:MAG: T9SS type A sorting domain-containing protein [Calditrichaeota bacterium]|nr:T9SS type A sorting domain-containing protein [Calditrichota bacterium]